MGSRYNAAMGQRNSQFSNAEEWRCSAMQRDSGISADECSHRARLAEAYNRQESISDPNILADQQLYIQGRMGLEEYQDYLLFKHANQTS